MARRTGVPSRATMATIIVPYSTSPGRRPVVLARGDFACLDYFDHRPSRYRSSAGIHVDREQLLSRRVANLIVRPGLYSQRRARFDASCSRKSNCGLSRPTTMASRPPSRFRTSSCSRTENRPTNSGPRRGWRRLAVTLSRQGQELSQGQTVDLAAE